MKLIVCDLKGWVDLNSNLSKKHDIKFINKRDDLTSNLLETFKPDYVFFAHWNLFKDRGQFP